MFICCDDQTFYWGPFETKEAAEKYAKEAEKQSLDYYGEDIANVRSIQELSKPIE